jgi:uncharacterized SAM-binding protein YcdF (DUF218 family)
MGSFLSGLARYVASIPRAAATSHQATDAIVVLTGGGGRLEEGLALLERDLARTMFVSGVHPGIEVAELLRRAPDAPARLSCCVVLGHLAVDTRGNATETAAWAKVTGVRSLRLVTSNYHIARSMIEFRAAMPGVTVEPHPIPAPGIDFDGWWYRPRTLRLVAGEYVKLLLALGRTSLFP